MVQGTEPGSGSGNPTRDEQPGPTWGRAARGPTTQSEEGPAEPRPPLGLGAPETGGALSSPASSREREIAARGREPWRASWTLNPRGQEETPPYGENAKPDAAPQRRGWLMEAGGDQEVGEAAPRSSGITETAEGRSRGLTASGTIRLPHWGPRLTAPRPASGCFQRLLRSPERCGSTDSPASLPRPARADVIFWGGGVPKDSLLDGLDASQPESRPASL